MDPAPSSHLAVRWLSGNAYSPFSWLPVALLLLLLVVFCPVTITALASLLLLVVSIQKVYIQSLESTLLIATWQSSEDKDIIQNLLEQKQTLEKYIADTKPILDGGIAIRVRLLENARCYLSQQSQQKDHALTTPGNNIAHSGNFLLDRAVFNEIARSNPSLLDKLSPVLLKLYRPTLSSSIPSYVVSALNSRASIRLLDPNKYQTNTQLQRNAIGHAEYVLKRYERLALEGESGSDDLSEYLADSAASLLARILQENRKQQGDKKRNSN